MALMEAIPEPECEPLTWGDMIACWADALGSLRQCNGRLYSLQEWADDL